MRQIILDTETTGLEWWQGDRICQVALLELIDGEPTGHYWTSYLDPEREVGAGASRVNGLTWARLKGEPLFAHVADQLISLVSGAELIIHNAAFDLAFLAEELRGIGLKPLHHVSCGVTCTVDLARQRLPGLKHSLDNLCDHYGIDRRHRDRHDALVDCQLLAQVYGRLIVEPIPRQQETV